MVVLVFHIKNLIYKIEFFYQNIWGLRERISEGVLRDGYVFKYDISLPFTSFYKVVEVLRDRLRDPRIIRISGYGHLGIYKCIMIMRFKNEIYNS